MKVIKFLKEIFDQYESIYLNSKEDLKKYPTIGNSLLRRAYSQLLAIDQVLEHFIQNLTLNEHMRISKIWSEFWKEKGTPYKLELDEMILHGN